MYKLNFDANSSSLLRAGIVWLVFLGLFYQLIYHLYLRIHPERYCSYKGIDQFTNNCDVVAFFTYIFIPILIFLFIKVGRIWVYFTGIYLFIYLFIYLLTPNEAKDIIPYSKPAAAILFTAVYIAFSGIIFIIEYIKSKN